MELPLIISLFVVVALLATTMKRKNGIEILSVITAVLAFIVSVRIAFRVATIGTYAPYQLFSVDALGAIVMLMIACIGLFATIYSVAYLRQETKKDIIGHSRIRQYFVLLNFFMAAMFLAVFASNPIITWISIEATTLSTAFLISFYNKPSSMEAAWKYLIVNSVGLLLGFFGTLLYLTSLHAFGEQTFATWSGLLASATNFDPSIAKIAFIFIFIGYGVKVGFAPLHTWKPDAYSKAPAPIGTLFSGALLPIAFLVILKYKAITDAVIGPTFTGNIFLSFGIFSLALSSLIIFVSRNYKRFLAYSSIEHAGVMALGFGFGGIGASAAILHMLYHSLIKSPLFLLSGNFLLTYGSAKIKNIRGALSVVPATSVLFIVGVLAIAGAPPFGIFFTKLSILSVGIQSHPVISIAALFFFAIIFVGLFKHASNMIFGEKPEGKLKERENIWLILPPLVLLIASLSLSFHIPNFLQILIAHAVLPY